MTALKSDKETMMATENAIKELKKSPNFWDSWSWMCIEIGIEEDEKNINDSVQKKDDDVFIQWVKKDKERLKRRISTVKRYIQFYKEEREAWEKELKELVRLEVDEWEDGFIDIAKKENLVLKEKE